jgi:hypothetical protein
VNQKNEEILTTNKKIIDKNIEINKTYSNIINEKKNNKMVEERLNNQIIFLRGRNQELQNLLKMNFFSKNTFNLYDLFLKKIKLKEINNIFEFNSCCYFYNIQIELFNPNTNIKIELRTLLKVQIDENQEIQTAVKGMEKNIFESVVMNWENKTKIRKENISLNNFYQNKKNRKNKN